MRTTIDIETPVLREIKRLGQKEGRSLGAVVSELLADALANRSRAVSPVPFTWTSRRMGARVDLSDKDALYAVLDEDRA
jgi:hypothetical protein